ncbi:MAG: hypothetical protein KAT77_00400 [Nanoarchaeota archaeon]|nr:hypothetical protein [Nanoarchaeota archaeon]
MNWGRILGYGMLGMVSGGIVSFFVKHNIPSLIGIAAAILFLRALVVIIVEIVKGVKEAKTSRRKNDNLWV